jgi:hypothetical protein
MINWFKKLFSKQEEKEECHYELWIKEQEDEHYLQKRKDSKQSSRPSKTTQD